MQHKKLFRLPQAILRARRNRGVSQKALAASVGVDSPRLSAIETGRVIGPGSDLIERLGAALDLTQVERDALVKAAAHDRVMREIARHYGPRRQRMLASSLDAARLLRDEDCDALTAFIEKLVGPHERLAGLSQSEEAAMT